MTIQERIEAAYKEAFKAHRDDEVTTLRFIKSVITNAEIAHRKQLDDKGTVPVLSGLAKRHRDSIAQFQKGGRPDLVAREKAQLAIVERYLPSQPTDDELRAAVREVVAGFPEKSPQMIGPVMAKVMPRFKGSADGNRVRAIAEQELSVSEKPQV